jgi:hypothetical protein
MLARVYRHFVAAMPVVHAKVTYSLVSGRGLLVAHALGLQVEDGGVRVLHADAPALHGGHAKNASVILAFVGFLQRKESESADWSLCRHLYKALSWRAPEREFLCTEPAREDLASRTRNRAPNGIQKSVIANLFDYRLG